MNLVNEIIASGTDDQIQSRVWIEGNFIYKTSHAIDHVVENECFVGTILNDFNHVNFVKFIKKESRYTSIENCLVQKHRDELDSMKRNISVWEHLDGLCFSNFIEQNHDEKIYKSLLLQVLYAVIQAYNELKFIHGDLHLKNIIIVSTELSEVKYNIDGVITVPTYGYLAKIIDFGNAVILNSDNFLYGNWHGLGKGCCNVIDDPLFDIRFFMDAFIREYLRVSNSEFAIKCMRVVENLFRGYDEFKTFSSSDSNQSNDSTKLYGSEFVFPQIEKVVETMFKKYNYNEGDSDQLAQDYCTIFTGLVKLPFLNSHTKPRIKSYESYLHSFWDIWMSVIKYIVVANKKIFLAEIINIVNEISSHKSSDHDQEKLFSAQFHDKLKEYGVDTISYTMRDTSLIYNILILLGKSIKVFMTDFISNYINFIYSNYTNIAETTQLIMDQEENYSSKNIINNILKIINFIC